MSQENKFAIIAAFLWGINYPLVKFLLSYVPETDFLILRFSAASILFAGYLLLSGNNFYVAKEHLIRLLFLGLLGVGVYNIIWTVGIHRTTAANAAILISASPIFTGIYSMFSGREKIVSSRWAGTILAFSGIFLIIYWTPGSEFSLNSSLFTGNILVLGGSILFSLYAILAKPLLQYYSPSKLTCLAMLLGLPVILLYALSRPHSSSFLYPAAINLGLAYSVIFGTVVAFIFWYKGLACSTPFKTVIFHYIVPVVSMSTAAIFLEESFNLGRILGGILVFAGLLVVRWEEAAALSSYKKKAVKKSQKL